MGAYYTAKPICININSMKTELGFKNCGSRINKSVRLYICEPLAASVQERKLMVLKSVS